MAKNLKLKIKNSQLAKAINISGVKSKLKKKKNERLDSVEEKKADLSNPPKNNLEQVKQQTTEQPKRKAKSKSSFALEEEENLHENNIDSPEETKEPPKETSLDEIADRVPSDALSSLSKSTNSAPEKEEKPNKDPLDFIAEEKKETETIKESPEKKEDSVETPLKETKKANKPIEEKNKKNDTVYASEQQSGKKGKIKEVRDIKPLRRNDGAEKNFDSRARRGLRTQNDDKWRKRRPSVKSSSPQSLEAPVRPSKLSIKLPITIKDLASEMKLKASQLISKLFMQGLIVTLNDVLDDETTVQLLGHEFDCEITIDTTEEKRIRITDKTIKEEIEETEEKELQPRPPVVAFMGHVDHGKTSIIDRLRSSNRAASEAGAITQHIGAFQYKSDRGLVTILDTPGHEAFSAMRARGAEVTDIVVLVVAGDEGLRQQTIEAIQHSRAANVCMVIAINKSDKPNFNAEEVYRQLADNDLLPEAWGGSTITVNCSATSGDGVHDLLEMVMLQAEMLELKANSSSRARGSILESAMHKGMGSVATVLVQNGTLKKGDSLVLGNHWGRVKTMRNERFKETETAPPSSPVEITGLSGLPEAGQEFIVMESEKEARNVSNSRMEESHDRQILKQKRGMSLESLLQQAKDSKKKVLKLVLRADMQGSLEAIKSALSNIQSDKIETDVIFSGAGEISESDIQLAAASKAIIIGFHTQIENHAETLIKQLGVRVYIYDIIYHAVDKVKGLMTGMLDKLVKEQNMGSAEVRTTFKVSRLGVIAGCYVSDGIIKRNHQIKVNRDKDIVWQGSIQSIKREKDDVKEVQKGFECGILLDGFSDIREGDILESYETIQIAQEL